MYIFIPCAIVLVLLIAPLAFEALFYNEEQSQI